MKDSSSNCSEPQPTELDILTPDLPSQSQNVQRLTGAADANGSKAHEVHSDSPPSQLPERRQRHDAEAVGNDQAQSPEPERRTSLKLSAQIRIPGETAKSNASDQANLEAKKLEEVNTSPELISTTSARQSSTVSCASTKSQVRHPAIRPDPDSDPSPRGGDEHGPDDGEDLRSTRSSPSAISRSITLRLYISHFLSTWNSRLFEMGAVLFLATIFPSTLLPMSVYALVRSGSAILFSPAIGGWIDRGDRLRVVRVSILGQRVAVAASCVGFWVLLEKTSSSGEESKERLRMGLFALVTVLACVEKLCAVGNLVAVERDWVVVITEGNEPARQVLNARMRRIDLFCKLLGPLVISLIDGASTVVAIWVTLGLSVVSVFVEIVCIARVYQMEPALRRSMTPSENVEVVNTTTDSGASNPASRSRNLVFDRFIAFLCSTSARLLPLKSIPFYFHHPVFLPSISLSLLYLTVLSFSGQMITFLLSSGYNSFHVGIARTISTIFELSATWVAPRVMKRIGAIRGGIWFLAWQMAWLAGGISWFFGEGEAHGSMRVFAASGLVGGVILSRVGLWGFDLCAQTIIQDSVPPSHRGSFSTVETSFQNLFELLSYVSTIIFSQPDQFQWPAVISAAAVYTAGALYASFVRRRRGHLLHPPPCLHPKVEIEEQ